MKKWFGRVAALGLAAGLLCSAVRAAELPVQVEGDHIALVELSDLELESSAALKAAVEAKDAQVDRWIVDLRGSRSTDVSAGAEAAWVFTGAGELAYLRDGGDALSVKRKEESAVTVDPVIVLVGQDTACGGELFAANVRAAKAGLVIGSRTAGVGTIESPAGQVQVYAAGATTFDGVGVIPHLCVEEDAAPQVARLLCGAAPRGTKDGWLRVYLGARWWYVATSAAVTDPEAFRALLEALPPQAKIFVGSGESWVEQTVAAVASWFCPGYTPRVFGDVDLSSPYADAINALKCYGILKGDQTGNFLPGVELNRATLCALLAQAMNYPKSQEAPAFSDTPADAWYTPYVTTLSAMEIVNGVGGGLFAPDDPITHEQFMTIVARIAANTDLRCWGAMEAGPTEEDLAAGAYAGYAGWARNGVWLLDGRWHAPAAEIDPQGVTLREEAAYDLWSMLTLLGLL